MRRFIALLLVLTQFVYFLPAQEMGADVRRGMARLERYLDRAAIERSAAGWEQLAMEGLEAALLEWEGANLYLKESDPEYWSQKREEAEWIYGIEKEKAYIGWASARMYAEFARAEGSALAAELRRAAAQWTYMKDGEETRRINMADAPGARTAWDLVAGEIIERYLGEWEEKHNIAYGELRARFAGSGLEDSDREAIYGGAKSSQRAAVLLEYGRIAAAEGNDLMRVLLYDSQSMKKRTAGEAAGAIARRLAEEAKSSTEREIERLFGELELLVGAEEQEGIQITSGEWLASFRSALEAGLARWDEAEYAFLAARAEWERDAEDAFLAGEEVWKEAYAKLREARDEWTRDLQEKLDEGRLEWDNRGDALAVEMEDAYREFAAVLKERSDNKRKLIEAQTGIYERSRDLLELANQGIMLWYEQWGTDYTWYEEKYAELFESQGPPEYPGYEAGYIGEALQLGMRALTGWGAEELEKLETQLALWKELYLEVIKKIHKNKYDELEKELANKRNQLNTLQADLNRLNATSTNSQWAYEEQQRRRAEIQRNIDSLDASIREIKEKLAKLAPVTELDGDMDAAAIGGAVEGAKGILETPLVFSAALWQSGRQLVDGKTGWIALARKYRQEADNAVRNLYELCGIDIERMTMEGYGNELSTELLKAQAVQQYWEWELQVARAVEEYARRFDSSLESEEETERMLKQAQAGYAEALDAYNAAMDELQVRGRGIDTADAEYGKADAELQLLSTKVQTAREEYLAVTALVLGVSGNYIYEEIAKAAVALDEYWANRDSKHVKYLEALQAYEAAQHLAELAQKIEWLESGDKNQQSIEALQAKVNEVRSVQNTVAMLAWHEKLPDEGLSKEKQLLLDLGAEYAQAVESGQEKYIEALEAAVGAVWGAVVVFYEGRLAEAEKALEYLKGKDCSWAAPLSNNERKEKELRAWLAGQLAGIKEEIKIAESGQLIKLEQQQKMIEDLLEIGDSQAFSAAVDEKKNIEYLKIILQLGSELGFAGRGVAWGAYIVERKELGLEAEEADGRIRQQYEYLITSEVNRADKKAREEVKKVIDDSADYRTMGKEKLYQHIVKLREAGEGLGAPGQAALGGYIQGILEYAAARDVMANPDRPIDLEGAEKAYTELGTQMETIMGLLKAFAATSADTEEDQLPEAVLDDDINAILAILYITQEKLFFAGLDLSYAQYATREQKKIWMGEYTDYFREMDPAVFEAQKEDQKNALKNLKEDAPKRMLNRLESHIEGIAALFGDAEGGKIDGLGQGDFGDVEWLAAVAEQLDRAAAKAGMDYYGNAALAGSLFEQMGQYLAQYELSKGERKELEAEQAEKYKSLSAAQDAYRAYHEGEYGKAVVGIQTAYAKYNEAASELDKAYAALNAARLMVREKQEIYDFAQGVYLSDFGAGGAAGYETPKEKLGRVEYAYERARISAEVLGSLLSGVPAEGSPYGKALDDYRTKAQNYYLGLAAEFEAARTVVKQRELLAAAEYEERVALAALVRSEEEYKVPYVPVPEDGWLEEQTGLEAGDLNAYFTDNKAVSRENVYGEYTITQAEADTVEWLVQLKEKLKYDTEYFNDLMMAAVWLNHNHGEGDGKKEWYGESLDPANRRKESLDPSVPGNYSLSGLTDLEAEHIVKGTFEGRYTAARMDVLWNAYQKIINTTGGKEDLAKYLLYRNTTLAQGVGGEDKEHTVLATRAFDAVINWTQDRRDVYRKAEIALYATAAAEMTLSFLAPWHFAAATVALTNALIMGHMRSKYDAAIETLTGLKDGSGLNKKENDQYLVDSMGKYLDKSELAQAQREKLNIMLYGSAEAPVRTDGILPILTYGDFAAGLESLFTTEGLWKESEELYSEVVFKASEAGRLGTIPDAIAKMNLHLNGEYGDAQKELANQEEELQGTQLKAQAVYWTYLTAGQEISKPDQAELSRLAARACDTTLSAEERDRAAREYDALMERIRPAEDFVRELTRLAETAWGAYTWNGYAHDKALIEHAAGLYNDNRVYYEYSTEPYTQWAAEQVRQTILAAAERQKALELEVELTRLGIIRDDFIRQRAAWEAQMEQIFLLAGREWAKAAGRMNEGYAQWRRGFTGEYEAKTETWEANYLQFVLEKQEWVETQYVYAANVGNGGILAQAEADVGDIIARALEGARLERMGRETMDVGVYVETLLEGTALSRLMAQADSLADRARYGAQAVRKGNARETVAASLEAAKETQRQLNEDLRQGAARLMAQMARKTLEDGLAAYMGRLEAENAGMRKSQDYMVRADGYTVNAGGISRVGVVDSTLWGLKEKTQTVYRYQDFVTEGPQLQEKLDEDILSGLDSWTIAELVGQGIHELEEWGEGVFGKVDKNENTIYHDVEVAESKMTFDEYYASAVENARMMQMMMQTMRTNGGSNPEEKERTGAAPEGAGHPPNLEEAKKSYDEQIERYSREERDGKLGAHIGYRPIMKSGDGFDIEKGKYGNIEYEGKGELGKMLLDFQWNSMESQYGWAEAAKPVYDQKLWNSGGFIKPLTLKSAGAIVASVVAAVVTWGMATPIAAAVTLGIILANDLLFAGLDTAFTNKDNGEIWAEFGKKAVINTVSSAMSYGFGNLADSAAKAASGVATGAVSSVTAGATIATGVAAGGATNIVAGAVTKGVVTAVGTAITNVTTNMIGAIDFRTGEFDSDAFMAGIGGGVGLIANALGAGVSAGLKDGLNAAKGMDEFHQDFLSGWVNLASDAAAKLTEYTVYTVGNRINGNGWGDSFTKAFDDMGGLTLNVLSLKSLAKIFGGKDSIAGQMSIGLFEINFSGSGISASLGTGGINVGGIFDSFVDMAISAYEENVKKKRMGNDPEYYAEQMEELSKKLLGILDVKAPEDEDATGLGIKIVLDWYNNDNNFEKELTADMLFALFNLPREAHSLLNGNMNLTWDLRNYLNKTIEAPYSIENNKSKENEGNNVRTPGFLNVFHIFHGASIKYVSPDGYQELIVLKKDDKVIFRDSKTPYGGSFNFSPYMNGWVGHFYVDMLRDGEKPPKVKNVPLFLR
jgi:hypothetical protein